MSETNGNYEALELQEWRESINDVLELSGPQQVKNILDGIEAEAQKAGVEKTFLLNTPYLNTIPPEKQPPYPGSREIERRIKSLVRWNAMAMVVRANRASDGIGGHISTFASAATLYEVGFNHFWRAPSDHHPGDLIYYQGHASPGIYSRAYLEGRLSRDQLRNFRRDLAPGGGLTSYPHPWLMKDFWQFPTVSMGLGPIQAIYQARFSRYLEHRGMKAPSDQKIWAFLGDGETDEPESLAPISVAGREQLDNLVFVINCNLQRLDGPVRGNGKIVQELEARFRANNWNVIKVLWGSSWDDLLSHDKDGLLVKRFTETVDGQYQRYSISSGDYIRNHFFGQYPGLLKMVNGMSDEELTKLTRGGHDPEKVYTAYKAASDHKGQPTVIIAKTVKGYGLGEGGEGKNVAHNQKKMNEDELKEFRTRFGIPLSDEEVEKAPIFRPDEDSPEMQYLRERRAALGGPLPQRRSVNVPIELPDSSLYAEFHQGTEGRDASTTMVVGRIISKLLKDKAVGKLIVPIIPDEARTFGMEALFRQCGIYASGGQLYDPVDSDSLLYYKESRDGQLLQEGINEAGAMSSFIAAGTGYSVHGINTIPFYVFYSMFGFQRIGDLAWAAGDSRCKGFLMGGTAGRTTLNGEGLQHQDGHSHLIASTVPNCVSYDPALAYELAVIIEDGIKRMYCDDENVYYYITVMNENYPHPPMPEGAREGILKGLYKCKPADGDPVINLLGSGTILNEALKAQGILKEKYGVAADVWSVTSYNNLQDDCLSCERHNLLHPGEEPRKAYLQEAFEGAPDLFVATSDYMKTHANALARWFPGEVHTLGTDGFGRSETREALRDFFEVDARYVTLAALSMLARKGQFDGERLPEIMQELEIDPEKLNPVIS